MKLIFVVFFFLFATSSAFAKDGASMPKVVCEDVSWNDVLLLVEPYLSDTLYTALVMQGSSSEYHASAAAKQAMDKSLPEDVRRTLTLIIEAGC